MNRFFPIADTQMMNKHMKMFNIITHQGNVNQNHCKVFTPTVIVMINWTRAKGSGGCGKIGTLTCCWQEGKMTQPLGCLSKH